ncbi:glucan biosynthesis protein [Frigidibacter sp. RF13]|uniref:glucan biosynthesis protein n=1 Tax=Frigidibacter sp. RF13 TaxID=2997340 RepID=UPI0022721E2E|nr:glucan biosynthesis protein [Frigidibacter sp. RF13]MCY1126261.1 glucan biosynthesis protein [Frigidibacter sp. RF13]
MTDRTDKTLPDPARRTFLARGGSLGLLLATTGLPTCLAAQETPVPAVDPAAAPPAAMAFSFDSLTEAARARAAGEDPVPAPLSDFLAGLDYDKYQMIQFWPKRARWAEKDSLWRVLPFHVGWLFKEPVKIYEVTDGQAAEMGFTTADFEYRAPLKAEVPENFTLPGVAGFKLNHPINRGDLFDEVISFVGASYFRVLGQGNAYGLSSRGLAIDTGLSKAEEFPRFTGFWLEKPAPGAQVVTVYAALDSASVTGAYRFTITPGVETTVDVTARLFFRNEVEELGIAPLTSMFLYGEVNRARFDDYRPQVHDSNGLRIERADGDVIWRALNNPLALASSYFAETRPRRFGLHQRGRDFDDYQDAEAHYERRPSVDIEPLGDWGAGRVRLVEIPSALEVHDNIVAYWVPDQKPAAGSSLEISYRMHWGRLDAPAMDDRARVLETRGGVGGAAGNDNPPDTRKFVVDFQGGMLSRLAPEDAGIKPVVTVTNGKAENVTLHRIDGTDIWRLVFDVASDTGAVAELSAHVAGYGRKLTEIWMFQWVKS